jgi:hypothetical protein
MAAVFIAAKYCLPCAVVSSRLAIFKAIFLQNLIRIKMHFFEDDFNGLFDGLDLSSNKLGKTEKLKMS